MSTTFIPTVVSCNSLNHRILHKYRKRYEKQQQNSQQAFIILNNRYVKQKKKQKIEDLQVLCQVRNMILTPIVVKMSLAICKDSTTACFAGISTLWQWSLTWIALSDASFSWLYWAILTLGLQVTQHSSDVTHTLWHVCGSMSQRSTMVWYVHMKTEATLVIKFSSKRIKSSKAGRNGQKSGGRKCVTYCDHMTSLSTLPSVWSEEPLD